MLSVKTLCFIFDKCVHSNPENICVRMAIPFITASIVKSTLEMLVIVHEKGECLRYFCILNYEKYFLSLLHCIEVITIFLKVTVIVATCKHNKIRFSVLFRQTEAQPTPGERWALRLCLRIHSCSAGGKTCEGNRYTETRLTRDLIQLPTN